MAISPGGFRTRSSGLVDGCGRLQVDLLPIPLDDSGPDLGGGLALLVLLVGVIQLFQAGCALRPMRTLKAAMQAVMPHAVAVAVARLLMKHARDLGRQLVSV